VRRQTQIEQGGQETEARKKECRAHAQKTIEARNLPEKDRKGGDGGGGEKIGSRGLAGKLTGVKHASVKCLTYSCELRKKEDGKRPTVKKVRTKEPGNFQLYGRETRGAYLEEKPSVQINKIEKQKG